MTAQDPTQEAAKAILELYEQEIGRSVSTFGSQEITELCRRLAFAARFEIETAAAVGEVWRE